MENRSVGIELPSQNIQSSDKSSSVYPSLTFEGRQVASQPKGEPAKILDNQENVEIVGNEFEKPENPKRTTKKYLRFPPSQSSVLKNSFKNNPNPTPKEREAIAITLGATIDQVNLWYERRRYRLITCLRKATTDGSSPVSVQPNQSQTPIRTKK